MSAEKEHLNSKSNYKKKLEYFSVLANSSMSSPSLNLCLFLEGSCRSGDNGRLMASDFESLWNLTSWINKYNVKIFIVLS